MRSLKLSNKNYLLGYDVGSSSIKATLLDADTGKVISSEISPKTELKITAKNPGWAEQEPESWWEHIINATKEIRKNSKADLQDVKAIGISYQMHGLVTVDKNLKPLYPSIIWCDSRAVDIGNKAFKEIGETKCLKSLLNSPGNFTISKLKWVKDNLPQIYDKIYKIMLPGDYIAMKMSGEITTTPSGLSEGIMWDFQKQDIADIVFSYYGISKELLPDIVPTFSHQGELSKSAAEILGLKPKTVISYRAGDQPNNALSLNVLNPGEIATTAGTSGVIYGIGEKPNYDEKSRVNTFVHVNSIKENPRYGILLCLNGTGILNSWVKNNLIKFKNSSIDYDEMNEIAEEAPIGSNGLIILPYGNGAERTLENRNLKASIHGLEFNIHNTSHFLRAIQEGIIFALNYGLQIMKDMGININKVRAGKANMFLSPLFRKAFATVTNSEIELYNTDGSQGAARGAGIGAGIYKNFKEAFNNLEIVDKISPDKKSYNQYYDAYNKWLEVLKKY